ncbi:hypothetical protein LCGC14_0430040 [marine sediment metagenome]|uniref:Uncharacterized protein n=1 Tax=marine sediment metagenome TaxID=412755 RepID=A0A0F9VXX1_9ZZZZ
MKFEKYGFNGGWGLEFGLTLGSSSGILGLGKYMVRWNWPFKIRIFGISNMQRAKQYGSQWRRWTKRS